MLLPPFKTRLFDFSILVVFWLSFGFYPNLTFDIYIVAHFHEHGT